MLQLIRSYAGTYVGYSTALTLLFLILFATGMASIMYEVVLLSFVTTLVGITEFSAGMVIGGFMGGLGLGAFAGAWYTRRKYPLLLLFVVAEALIALYGFSFFALAEALGIYSSTFAMKSLFISWALLFPSFLMGIELPVAVQWLERGETHSGTHVGVVYAGDTLGGVLGALTAGIFFIPLLGLEGTMIAGGILNAATVFLIFSLVEKKKLFGIVLSIAVLIGGSTLLFGSQKYFTEASLSFFRLATRYNPIEAAHSPFQYSAIIDHPTFGISLYFDDTLFVGTVSRAYHEFSVLPAVNAHPDAQRVLVIGGGDGGALYQLVRAGIPHIVHVDIDEKLVNLSRKYLQKMNGGVFDDPRIERHFMDGRTFLQQTDQQFDIIIVDVPAPRRAQLSSMWSKEFYELAKTRLSPGGILVPHIPNNQYLEAQTVILATIRSVFKYTYRYEYAGGIRSTTDAIQASVIASDAYDPRVVRRKKVVEGDHWYESSRHAGLFHMPPFERRYFDTHKDIISTDRNPAVSQFLQPQYRFNAVRQLEYERGLPSIISTP